MEYSAKRIGKMAFYAKTPSGHDIHMDAKEASGGDGSAPSPMEMVLAALMGCTSMDVVSILSKMKVSDYEYSISANYEYAKEHPKVFTSIELVYHFSGKNLPKDKIEKAVNLSQERYCSVSAMLKNSVDLTMRIEYEGEEN
ncbi:MULTISPECIES: OsmC family protein [unclassified Mesotoga]|uniref:OsmC family protein n=1 Tax=unclassified Mesotoga TaxID=1184398 RepID=UPI000DA6A5F8|nr:MULTISPECIES: OsmC family protein [unclassified Mesotoga]PZC53004.1 osmotically inducible protein C [Mesotoga sp. TolDC]